MMCQNLSLRTMFKFLMFHPSSRSLIGIKSMPGMNQPSNMFQFQSHHHTSKIIIHGVNQLIAISKFQTTTWTTSLSNLLRNHLPNSSRKNSPSNTNHSLSNILNKFTRLNNNNRLHHSNLNNNNILNQDNRKLISTPGSLLSSNMSMWVNNLHTLETIIPGASPLNNSLNMMYLKPTSSVNKHLPSIPLMFKPIPSRKLKAK